MNYAALPVPVAATSEDHVWQSVDLGFDSLQSDTGMAGRTAVE